MKKAFKQYFRWVGIWIGGGETQLGNPVRVRFEIKERLNGESLELSVEYCHADTHQLLHGVVGLLGGVSVTGFAMAVTYPRAGNIGGGGFMMIHLASGEDVAIDYRESAPAAGLSIWP